MQASYQHAFTAVRQLAALMRTALSSKSADSYKAVYCWQTVNCMELWAKVGGRRGWAGRGGGEGGGRGTRDEGAV